MNARARAFDAFDFERGGVPGQTGRRPRRLARAVHRHLADDRAVELEHLHPAVAVVGHREPDGVG
jgi:hypothetical protein